VTIKIRELNRTADRRGVEAIDTTFETSSVFDVVTTPRRIDLVERPLAKPLAKQYSIGEVFARWARWEVGWVADDGDVRGFATAEYEPWHARLVLWFLYISPAYRGRSRAARARRGLRPPGRRDARLARDQQRQRARDRRLRAPRLLAVRRRPAVLRRVHAGRIGDLSRQAAMKLLPP
jgi:hypothetical protein